MPLGEAEYEALEGFESESEAADRRRPFTRPKSESAFKPRSPPGAAPVYVTQAQLELVTTKLEGKLTTLTNSSAGINARVASLQAAFKKETEERKKTGDSQNKELNQKVQLLTLLPLLVTPPSAQGPKDSLTNVPLADSAGNIISAVSVPSSGGLNAVLPLLLVSGLGGSGPGSGGGYGLGGDSGSGSDNSLVFLALVLALAK